MELFSIRIQRTFQLVSTIKKKVPDIHTQQLVENTERQARKLVNEIEALLITARKDRQKVYLQKEETDLVLLVTEVAQEVSMQHSHQPHQIKMESELNELNLMLDPLICEKRHKKPCGKCSEIF